MFPVSPQNLYLYLNETKSDTENVSNWNYFGFVGNNKRECEKKDHVWSSSPESSLAL